MVELEAERLGRLLEISVVGDDGIDGAAQVLPSSGPQHLHEGVVFLRAEHGHLAELAVPLEAPLHSVRLGDHHRKGLPHHAEPVLGDAELDAEREGVAGGAVGLAVDDVCAVHVQEARHGPDYPGAVRAKHREDTFLQGVDAFECMLRQDTWGRHKGDLEGTTRSRVGLVHSGCGGSAAAAAAVSQSCAGGSSTSHLPFRGVAMPS